MFQPAAAPRPQPHPYSSPIVPKSVKTYGGQHHHGLIEKGDNHLSTLVTSRPWLVNTYDISPVTRHNKNWDVKPELLGRIYEPHFKAYGPTLGGRRPVQSWIVGQ